LQHRDMHEVVCEKNPRNSCYCGKLFPNPTARDKHAATCEENPANVFECPHCDRLFVTRYGVMGMVVSDGRRLRDAHERGCNKNTANECFCGQLFANPEARDRHASTCSSNPVNRFHCRHCRKVFVTQFGMFTTSGAVERDAHQTVCSQNPANSTCVHCNQIFTDTEGFLGHFRPDSQRRCRLHADVCCENPKNRYACECCGRNFVTRRGWLRRADGKAERDKHQSNCDVIPCEFQLKGDEGTGWHLVASPDATASGRTMIDSDAVSSSNGSSDDETVESINGATSELSDTRREEKENQQDANSEASDPESEAEEERTNKDEQEKLENDEEEEDDEDNFHDALSACGESPAAGSSLSLALLPPEAEETSCQDLQLVGLSGNTSVAEAMTKAWEEDAFQVL